MAVNDRNIPSHISHGQGDAITGRTVHPGNIARDGAPKRASVVNVAWGQHRRVDGVTTSLAAPHNSVTETVQSGAGPTPLSPVVSKNLAVLKIAWGSESQSAMHAALGKAILDEAKRSAPGDHPARLGIRGSK